MLFVPETNFLHVGGGQVSGAVDLAKRLVATQETPVLFWGFARVDRYVVEYGELESARGALPRTHLETATNLGAHRHEWCPIRLTGRAPINDCSPRLVPTLLGG